MLNLSSHSLIPCKVYFEVSADSLMGGGSTACDASFFLVAFKTFSLPLILGSFITMLVGEDLSGLDLFGDL